MLTKILTFVHGLLLRYLGRDRLEYLASNTMNVVTQKLDPFIWSYKCQAKIIDIRQETSDTKTFILLPNQHFKQAVPGQHIEVSIDTADGTLTRCYTLSATDSPTISITVKLSPQGKVSNWLHNRAKIGMRFTVSSPRGQFVYNEQDKVLLICAGSGITPGYAVLNHMLAQQKVPDIAFFYRSRTPELTIFRENLAATGRVTFSYSQPNDKPRDVNELSLEQQLSIYDDIRDRHIYLCGPESFKNDVLRFLTAIDYDFNQLEVEQFSKPINTTKQSKKFESDVTVHLKSQNISFTIKAQASGQTILEAAEEQGVQMAHGCRTGMCGSCRTNLVSGSIIGYQLGKTIYPCSSYANSAEVVLQ